MSEPHAAPPADPRPPGAAPGPDAEGEPDAAPALRGVVFDWGGVLTSSLDGAMSAWARRDGVDVDHFQDVMAAWAGRSPRAGGASVAVLEESADAEPVGTSPVHRLERGEIDVAAFERVLAAELARRGSSVAVEGLLDRMFGGLVHLDERMLRLVRRLRDAGFATALLSNSWGNHYPDRLWRGLFDTLVISGEVGMRKPEDRIFALTAERLGLALAQCVMVDDLAANVAGAVAAGMVGVRHRSHDETVAELEALLGVPLRDAGPE